MPTYYTPIARTQNSVSYNQNTDTVPSSGWDVSEYDDDSRGGPRVLDWSDIESMDEGQTDAMAASLGITTFGNYLGYISWTDTTQSTGNKYYFETANTEITLAYRLSFSYDQVHSISPIFDSHTLSTDPQKVFKLKGSSGSDKVLVWFANYQANGGHSTVSVNNTNLTWNSTNQDFVSNDGNTKLSHNGSTWVVTETSGTSAASYDGGNVTDWIDPTSSDLSWENNTTVSAGGSSGAIGDPHIQTFDGTRYTL